MDKFILYFICEMPQEHFYFWNDGLRAALNYLVKTYNWEVRIYNLSSQKPLLPSDGDFYLFWGTLSDKQCQRKFFKKQGLCLAGGTTYHPATQNFDVIFAESLEDFNGLKKVDVNVIQAFGTNIQLFRPIPEQPKVWDFIYPTAFALWKRHDLFVEYIKKCEIVPITHETGKKSHWCNKHNREIYGEDSQCYKIWIPTVSGIKALAVGYMQPEGWEKECYEVCSQNGVSVMSWVPPETLVYLYNMSKNVVLTPDVDGGCQRAVLEAKACGIPVIIDSPSNKLAELKDLTREQVLKDWNEIGYAEKLKSGIQGVMNG